MEKGSTFAPAFGENEGFGKRGSEGAKFFESLRPARASEKDAEKKEPSKEHSGAEMHREAEPEIQSRTRSKDKSTTKSLILAQDER